MLHRVAANARQLQQVIDQNTHPLAGLAHTVQVLLALLVDAV